MRDLKVYEPVLSTGDIVGEKEIVDNESCCKNHQNHKTLSCTLMIKTNYLDILRRRIQSRQFRQCTLPGWSS